MEQINLYDLIKFYGRKWRVIVALMLAGLVAGLVYNTFIQVPLYKSEATLLFVGSSQQNTPQGTTLLNNYVELFRSRRVLQPVLDSQNLDISYENFVGSVAAVNDKGTEVINLSVTTDKPKKSQDALTQAVISFKTEAKILYGSDNLSVIDNASDAHIPYNVRKFIQLGISTASGTIISLIVLFFIYDIKGGSALTRKVTKKTPELKKKTIVSSVQKKALLTIRSKATTKKSLPKNMPKIAPKSTIIKKAPTKKNNIAKKTKK